MKKIIICSAVALVNDQGLFLLAQRPMNKALGGKWEFPGGKWEEHETPEAAAVRELSEELGIIIDENDLFPVTFVSHGYNAEKFHLVMTFFICRKWLGEIKPTEHQAIGWFDIDSALSVDLAPADIPLLIDLKNKL